MTQLAQLHLQRAVISRYKSLKRVELNSLRNLVVFMGRNNAGKSNILDCFNFLSDATRGLHSAFESHGGSFAEIIYKKRDEETVEVQIDFAVPDRLRGDWIASLFASNARMTPDAAAASAFLRTVSLKVLFGKDHACEEITVTNFKADSPQALVFQHRVQRGKVECAEGQLEELCQSAAADLPAQSKVYHSAPAQAADLRLCLGQPEAPIPGAIAAQIGGSVRAEFANLEWMAPHRNMPATAPIKGESVLAPNAANLPDVLHWLYNNKPALFRKVESEVHKLVPHLGKLYTPTTASTATIGAMDPENEELFYTMNQLSYGTKSAIAVIAKLALARPGAWFSIEEPETYLHPQAQVALFRFLREESASKRVFVATHSTPIAASTPIESLFIVQRDAEYATVADPVSEKSVHRVIDQLGVQPSFSFDSEAIVFVEDGDDVLVFEAWSAKFPFQVKTQFLDAEGACTPRFFANARIALSKYVHTLVYAVFGSRSKENGPERQVRERLASGLKLPSDQIVTLTQPQVAAYLLDAKALRQAFRGITLSDADLEERLAQCRAQPDAKKALAALLQQFRIGNYNGELAARIADAMEAIPAPVKDLFERIDLASKPFWKI